MLSRDVESNSVTGISEYLAKPVPVLTGTFATSNTWGDFLFNSNIYTLFKAQTMWINKIQGYLSFRADVKIRVVINPTPFQSGLLKVCYFPCADTLGNEMNMHTYSRMTTSQLPGSYLNMNDNAVELTIPYLAPPSFLERDVTSPVVPAWGNIICQVMEILRTGTGPTAVSYTVWMSLENVELSGQIQPQMAGLKSRKGRNVTDAESNEGMGPITKILDSGVNLASSIAEIPTLAPLAVPAYWALAAARAAAQTLGWSKPLVTTETGYHAVGNTNYQQNFDGGDNSLPLSLSADNKISIITDAAPNAQDEMSMAFVNSQWSYLFDFGWGTGSTQGALLTSLSVFPDNMVQTSTVGGLTVSTCPPCAVLTTMFAMYRGSFEFNFTICKTGYHTGTLAFVFLPGKNVTTPSFADSSYAYRAIVDIQEASEYCFRVPYLIPQEYLATSEAIGKLFVFCVNPLQAPTTVSSTVDVFIQVRGAPDLQYQVPTFFSTSPFVPQGIHTEEDDEICLTLGASDDNGDGIHHAQLSIGEYFSSLLQLCKCYYKVGTSSYSSYPLNVANLSLLTHRYFSRRYNAGTTSLNISELGGDVVSFIASFYVFSRGSMRYRLCSANQPTSANTHTCMYRAALWADGDSTALAYNNSSITNGALTVNGSTAGVAITTGRMAQVPASNGCISIQSPFYSKYRYMLNQMLNSTGTGDLEYMPNHGVTFLQTGGNVVLQRAVGDDFQFSFFVGIPCFVNSAFG